jgi:hypothetical protein
MGEYGLCARRHVHASRKQAWVLLLLRCEGWVRCMPAAERPSASKAGAYMWQVVFMTDLGCVAACAKVIACHITGVRQSCNNFCPSHSVDVCCAVLCLCPLSRSWSATST